MVLNYKTRTVLNIRTHFEKIEQPLLFFSQDWNTWITCQISVEFHKIVKKLHWLNLPLTQTAHVPGDTCVFFSLFSIFMMFYNCILECPDGRFGLNCLYKCHCQNLEPCDKKTGKCTHCYDGWIGKACEQSKLYIKDKKKIMHSTHMHALKLKNSFC